MDHPSGQPYKVTEKGTQTKYFYNNTATEGLYPINQIKDAFDNEVNFSYGNDLLGSIWLGPVNYQSTTARYIGLSYRADPTKYGMSSVRLYYPDQGGSQVSRVWTFSIDSVTGRLTSVTYPFNGSTVTVSFTYTSNGNIESIKDARNNVWRYVYDGQGRVTKILVPPQTTIPATEIKYDDAYDGGKTWVLRYRDYSVYPPSDSWFKNNATEYTYGPQPAYNSTAYCPLQKVRDPQVTNPFTTTAGDTTSAESTNFNLQTGLIISKTDRRGIKTDYDWDSRRNLESTTVTDTSDPAGGTRKYITDYHYTSKDLADSVTTSFTLNGGTRVPMGKTTNQYSEASGTLLTDSYVYKDAAGFVPATNKHWRYATDNTGRLMGERLGSDPETIYGDFSPYNDQPQTVTNPLGSQSFVVYDGLGLKVSESVPNASGQLRTTSFTYDPYDRLIRATYPDGTISTTSYLANGLVLRETDRLGNSTSYAYDTEGRRTSQTTDATLVNGFARTITTQFGYDFAGNLTSVQTPDYDYSTAPPTLIRTRSVSYGYDQRNRRISTTMADGNVEWSHYDPNGNADFQRDGIGNVTTLVYDGLNRLRRTSIPLGNTVTFDYTQTTSGFEKSSTLTPFSGSAITTLEKYNFAGQMVSNYQSEPDAAVTYAYDDAGQTGRKTSMTVGAQTWTYGYADDAGAVDGRLYSLSQTVGAPIVAKYAYNLNDSLLSRTSPGGNLKTVFGYDVDSRLINVDHYTTAGGTAVLQQSIQHTYDVEGRTTVYRDLLSGAPGYRVLYDHDLMDRLTRERTFDDASGVGIFANEYQYDALGNRTAVLRTYSSGNTVAFPYVTDANDKFRSGDGYAVSAYDNNGRPTSLTYPDGSTAALGYAKDDQLLSIGARGAVPGVSFKYDAMGRRVRQTGGPTGAAKTFVFDGDAVIAEKDATTWTFRLPGVGYVENGAQFYERENAQGSTVATLDAAGALASRAFYDAYGIESMLQPGPRSRYGFAGKHGYAADGASGMLLCGARFYVPAIGRFLTSDPIGHSGGLNLYAYCDNNPLGKVDPDGTQGFNQSMTNGVGIYTQADMNHFYGGIAKGIANEGLGTPMGAMFGVGYYTYKRDPLGVAISLGALGLNIFLSGLGEEGNPAAFRSVIAENVINGAVAESALRTATGGVKQFLRTSQGPRFIDSFVGGFANESKVGYTTMTRLVRSQISKDAELLARGRVRAVYWHFYQSPVTGRTGMSQQVFNSLRKSGIRIVIH